MYRTRAEAVGEGIPPNIVRTQIVLTLPYWSRTTNEREYGQLVVARELKEEVTEIFLELLHLKFPIHSMIPIVAFNNNDERSMAANNTSAFNYRTIKGTTLLSMHALGRAIDINPFLNPCIYGDGRSVPEGAKYNQHEEGVLWRGCKAVRIFTDRGWVWGGDWDTLKDYQHFEKPRHG